MYAADSGTTASRRPKLWLAASSWADSFDHTESSGRLYASVRRQPRDALPVPLAGGGQRICLGATPGAAAPTTTRMFTTLSLKARARPAC